MKGRGILAFLLAVVVLAVGTGSAFSKGGKPGKLEVYTVTLASAEADELSREGFDAVATRQSGDKVEVDVVLSASERDQLDSRFDVEVKRNRDGLSATQLAARQAAGGYQVFRSWDEPGGIKDELKDLAQRNPRLVKLVTLGTTHQAGRSSR